MHKITTYVEHCIFHGTSFENLIFGICRRVETLKVGLKITVSTRSIATSNQILKRVVISCYMKNNMQYSKQYTTDSTNVKFAALVITTNLFFAP